MVLAKERRMECDYIENSKPVKIQKEATKDESPETTCKHCSNTSTFSPRPTTTGVMTERTEHKKRISTL